MCCLRRPRPPLHTEEGSVGLETLWTAEGG
jgi:hypothetical protein